MIGCLIGLIVMVIVALVALWVLETVVTSFGVSPPPQILLLVRLLVALLVLLYALQCLGVLSGSPGPWRLGCP